MTANPGYANQGSIRLAFRVASVLLLAVTLWAGYVGLHALFTDPFASGAKPWMMFVAIFGLFLTGVCAQAGFGGAAARYAAGETMPVVRDSASYLTDGEGVLGVGRTVGRGAGKTGPFCSTCGVRNDEGARFCDACGSALA